MPERIVIGTRGSRLALAQAVKVREILEGEGFEAELRIIKTSGDIKKDMPLHEFRGAGAFVREIDLALRRGEIDIAVHSLKDVPTDRVEGTVISGVLERESPCDAFISGNGKKFSEIDENSIIGTSSLRRRAMVRKLRKDVRIENLRGNIDTRLKKLEGGHYDGIFLAEAGLIRIGWNERIRYERMDPHVFVPSANQGIIAVASRMDDREKFGFMNHEKTFREAMVERYVIKELGIGCAIPAGVYARTCGSRIRLLCEILSLEGDVKFRIDEKIEYGSEDEIREILKGVEI